MAYEPTEWKKGDVVTSAKLNKIEQELANGGGVLVVHDNNDTLDKTYAEIETAGFAVLKHDEQDGFLGYYVLTQLGYSEEAGCFIMFDDDFAYVARAKSDYPTILNHPK